ncbi:MAG: hypothetical protein LBH17_06610 [Oscillospiraceae bacterium]|jgi:hypothetical protein|nr:hypothetical protein [Oscillospiraceae bacterium]
MKKFTIMRLTALVLIFVLALGMTGSALATDEESYPIIEEETIQGGSSPSDPTNTTWATLSEAKKYYGEDFTYHVGSFNVARGAFLAWYDFSDGTHNYFWVGSPS